ncbi:MAG: DUF1122 family protein [Dehalococcoidia bacterium]
MTDSIGQWRDAADAADTNHPLAALDAIEVGQGVRLRLQLGERHHGTTAFRAFLDADDLGRTLAPVFAARHHAGAAGESWVEVTDFAGHVPVAGGEVELPEGIDLQIVQALAGLVDAGGHLTMEYGSEHRRVTARALRQGVPPVATPLGGMLFAVGCGVAFTDLGATEGRRELQGYRALDRAHEVVRAPAMLEDLEWFMDHSAELDWDLQLKCRPLAEAAITVLRSRLGVLARAFEVN